MSRQVSIYCSLGALIFIVVALLSSPSCLAQDYDDEGYGNQGNNQGDNDNYNGASSGYGADDGYNNMPNQYQQNVDSDGSQQQPSNYQPQGGAGAAGNSDEGDYEGDDGAAAAAASSLSPTVVRVRRSANLADNLKTAASGAEPKLRVKRHGKYYIGPVYTYVKTDKHANFKWGVKHKVGKKHYG